MIDQRVCIELDALLDTRLATIAIMDNEAALSLIDDKYRYRLDDDFETLTDGKINNVVYNAKYAQRDVETLKKALHTKMFNALEKMMDDLRTVEIAGIHEFKKLVVLNTWPYKDLTSEEITTFRRCIESIVGADVKVETAYIPASSMSPQRIKDSFDCVIMYDFNEWLNIHRDSLIHCKIPRCTLMHPAISYVGKIDKEKLEIKDGVRVNPFELLEYALAEFIGMESVDSAFFSIP